MISQSQMLKLFTFQFIPPPPMYYKSCYKNVIEPEAVQDVEWDCERQDTVLCSSSRCWPTVKAACFYRVFAVAEFSPSSNKTVILKR